MRAKFLALPLLALGLAACSEAEGPMEPQFNNGVSNPGTSVTSTFTVTLPEYTTFTYLSAPKNNKGRCEAGGVWFNQAGNNGGANHQQCTNVTVVAGQTINVSFSEVANFVLAKSGNINLNFTPTCSTDELGVTTCTSRQVQYSKNANWTTGTGVVLGTADNGGTWAIDLSQIGHAGNASMLGRSIGPVVAAQVGGSLSYGAATLSW